MRPSALYEMTTAWCDWAKHNKFAGATALAEDPIIHEAVDRDIRTETLVDVSVGGNSNENPYIGRLSHASMSSNDEPSE